MGKALAVVRRCRNHHLTPDLGILVVSALVLSQLDYCQIVWANATKKYLNRLQFVKKTGCTLCSTVSLQNQHRKYACQSPLAKS